MAEPMKLTTVLLPPDLKAGLEALKVRYGVPEGESIRRALRAYLEAQDALEPTPKARKGTAKKTAKR